MYLPPVISVGPVLYYCDKATLEALLSQEQLLHVLARALLARLAYAARHSSRAT